MKFIQTHGEGSDCTASYDVVLDKKYTVADLVEEILTRSYRFNEWGKIKVSYLFTLQYRYGKTSDDIPPEYAKRIVHTPVKASGGWCQMDYNVDIIGM